MSPGSRNLNASRRDVAQTPAKKSACSSSRTESWFDSAWPAAAAGGVTWSEMPRTFCTWCPTSWAIT